MFQANMFENSHDLLLDDYDTNTNTDIMEIPSSDDQEPNQRPNKKKRYRRHTQHQIQEMESFFKKCPHPDDKQRKELGRRLGLEQLQVKFWFQNKRTQIKVQHEHLDNSQLRKENEKLQTENISYKEALANATCSNCGGPIAIGEMSFEEQQLRTENARLREEIDTLSGIIAKYFGKPVPTHSNLSPHGLPHSLDQEVASFGPQGMASESFEACNVLQSTTGPTVVDRQIIIKLAVAAMDELIRIAQVGEPLWVPSSDNSFETLDEDEYFRSFPRSIGPKPLGLKSEASRESRVVIMNHINLVEILMDVDKWSNVFFDIVSKAMAHEVLSTGVAGNYDGALKVMTAEYQVPTPLVPTREPHFVRYCKQHGEGTWVVVDVSLDNVRPSPIPRCRRRPSGCLIQELPNGYSKVTWVEHVEVDDRAVHNIYKLLVNSGLAFGAKRWVAILDRRCERLASMMANNVPAGEAVVITNPEKRKGMLKVAERMVLSFFTGVGASTTYTWTTLSNIGADDVRVMTQKSIDEPGKPPGIVLSAATSFWIPVPPKRVFDYLRDEKSRREWDILSNGGLVEEKSCVANGGDPGNCVSLLCVNSANSSHSNMIILQESSCDSTGSYVIYAPVDIEAMHVVLSGGDPDYVALLPSGFAILPDGPRQHQGGIFDVGTGGSLLTVSFQILVDSAPTAKLSLGSVTTVNSLIKCTVQRIKAAIASNNP